MLGAAILSLYAGWMAADVVNRWLLFPIIALLSGLVLYQRCSADAQAVYVGYTLALMLAVTPIVISVADLTAGFDASPAALVITAGNLLLFVIFGTAAAVVAYLTYRFDGGRGVVEAIRTRAG